LEKRIKKMLVGRKNKKPYVKDPVKECIAEYNNKINLALLVLSKLLKLEHKVSKQTIRLALKNLRQAKSLQAKYGFVKKHE